ncbi:MAG: galactose-1-phosphate uridylyltransferase [Candidatus Bathyarchaeia archaeon]|jgi:UDPglucose--hexose-1-phosphate uridylyltransferase
MTFNEVRKDYLLDRWVVIATERGRRPTDFAKQERQQAKTAVCPMCPGNEHMTPPAVLVYLKSSNGIRKTKDEDESRHKNWLIRVIPNLYPAFSPPKEKISPKQIMKNENLAAAVGHHEVLVESPNHDEDPANAPIPQVIHVVNGYIDRLRDLSTKPYVQYVSIFRNHGLEAGASLSHAHSQIIATPFVPKTVKEEMDASRKFWRQNKKCAFCDIIEKERDGPRLVLENSKFIVFAPYASVNPMEFWIFPRKHESSLLGMSHGEVKIFAETLKTCLGRLKTLVNDPPYNYGFHMALDKGARDYYHWHLEVYPRLAIWAGFEKSTGVYINTMTPETAAESMRKNVSS